MIQAKLNAVFPQAWTTIETKDPELAKAIKTTDAKMISAEVVNKVIRIIKAAPEIMEKIGPKKVKDYYYRRVISMHSKPDPEMQVVVCILMVGFVGGLVGMGPSRSRL